MYEFEPNVSWAGTRPLTIIIHKRVMGSTAKNRARTIWVMRTRRARKKSYSVPGAGGDEAAIIIIIDIIAE